MRGVGGPSFRVYVPSVRSSRCPNRSRWIVTQARTKPEIEKWFRGHQGRKQRPAPEGGMPPKMRIHGKLKNTTGEVLTEQRAEELIFELMSPAQKEYFLENGAGLRIPGWQDGSLPHQCLPSARMRQYGGGISAATFPRSNRFICLPWSKRLPRCMTAWSWSQGRLAAKEHHHRLHGRPHQQDPCLPHCDDRRPSSTSTWTTRQSCRARNGIDVLNIGRLSLMRGPDVVLVARCANET